MKSHMEESSIVSMCSRAADLLLGYPWKLWFWADSIGMEGLLDASVVTGEKRYSAYVYGFLKAWIPRIENHSRFDHTAASLALVRCYQETGDEALLQAAIKFAGYLSTFRQTACGCLLHYEDAHIELPPELPSNHPDYDAEREAQRRAAATADGGPCVFVDSVHFQGPFLSALYHETGDEAFLLQAEETIGPQVQLLWDERECLFHHFWSERVGERNGVLWGRGNGWGLLGVLHTLEYLPPDRPLARRFRDIVAQQAERLVDLQDASGDWHTVLNDESSYLEPSIAAFVVDGFSRAIRHGWIAARYRSVVESAWLALCSHVRADGLLDGVSFETFPSFRADHYKAMPQGALVPWGQDPLLTACRSYLALQSMEL